MLENGRFNLIKRLLVSLIVVIIVVFVMLLVFPTKNYLKPLMQDVFRNNLNSMQEAAETYFTNDRLPENIGDKKRLTLQEMLDMNLLIPFVDKNGNECSTTKSYVEIIKEKDEYILKVNLSCGSDEAYIIEHLGCHDICKALGKSSCDICPSCDENKDQVPKEVIEYELKREVSNKKLTGYSCPDSSYTYDSNTNTCSKTVTESKTIEAIPVYESETKDVLIGYRCDKEGYVLDEKNKTCTKTTTKVLTENANPIYENKTTTTNRPFTLVEEKKYLYKYQKEVTTTTYTPDTTQPIYADVYTKIGSYKQRVCDGYTYFQDGTSSTLYQEVSDWVYSTTVRGVDYVPSDTYNVKYVIVGMDYDKCQENCSIKPYYEVDVYTRNVIVYDSSNITAVCNVKEVDVPIYANRSQFTGKFVTNKTVKKEILTEWSESKNDQNLINQNYGYVGKMKENGSIQVRKYGTCPNGTSISSTDESKCVKQEKVISGYSCPTNGFKYDAAQSKCVKVEETKDVMDAVAVYESKTNDKLIGYRCESGYALNGKKCSKTYTKDINVKATPNYKTVFGYEYKWHTSKTLSGWTFTGNTRKRTIYVDAK